MFPPLGPSKSNGRAEQVVARPFLHFSLPQGWESQPKNRFIPKALGDMFLPQLLK